MVQDKKMSLKLINYSPSLFIVIGSLLLTVLLNKVVFYCPTSATGFYIDFLKITLQKGLPSIVRDNISALLEAIKGYFHYDTDNGIRTALVTIMESFGLSLCIAGFVISITKRQSFDDIFFVLVCGLILYYPIHDSRYFLPAIAIVFFYCYISLERILPVITKIKARNIGIILTVIYLVAGFRYFKSITRPPFGYVPGHADSQAFNYIKQHLSESDIIICARPRLITLYTNKKCMIHAWQYPMEINKKIFESAQANYLLLVNGFVDDYYLTYLRQYQYPVDSEQIAPGYMLYKLK